MSEKKILTLHPEGKKGVNILKRKYDVIRDFIILTFQKKDEISFEDLTKMAVESLTETFDGKVTWYLVTVKLDLEARDIIERIPGPGLQRLRLKK